MLVWSLVLHDADHGEGDLFKKDGLPDRILIPEESLAISVPRTRTRRCWPLHVVQEPPAGGGIHPPHLFEVRD